MQIQEFHPALVHYPIALLPTALAADALGSVTGSKTLQRFGRGLMPLAAISAAVSGLAGLVAQEACRADEEAMEMLVTHRNLNIGLIGLTGVMAVKRAGKSRASARYLLAGAAGVGAMVYSAYLGGRMVYAHGVGVSAAGGVREDEAPEIGLDNVEEGWAVAAQHLTTGIQHTVEDFANGQVVPRLTRSAETETPQVPNQSS